MSAYDPERTLNQLRLTVHFPNLWRAMNGRLDPSLVLGDELVGDVVEVVADNLRLRADVQHIIADTFDQRGLPACRDGAERVPGVAGDHAELRGFGAEFLLDIGVSLARRLVMLDAVRAEPALEQIDDAAMLKLSGLHLEQVVGQRE